MAKIKADNHVTKLIRLTCVPIVHFVDRIIQVKVEVIVRLWNVSVESTMRQPHKLTAYDVEFIRASSARILTLFGKGKEDFG
jgi:hypothetical protein